MVDAETILYVGMGVMAVSGAGLIVATRVIEFMNPKVYLHQEELDRISELEQALRDEKQSLEALGNLRQSNRYQRVTAALENLTVSNYREQGWIRAVELEDAERTYQVFKLGISPDSIER